MNAILESLAPGWTPGHERFKPVARYYAAMDFLLYLKEDCSCVEDRIDSRLTLLWHPYERRAVGVRLKGFRALYQHLKTILANVDGEFEKKVPFVSLVALLEMALVSGAGDKIVHDAEKQRMHEGYQKARELLSTAPRMPLTEIAPSEKIAA